MSSVFGSIRLQQNYRCENDLQVRKDHAHFAVESPATCSVIRVLRVTEGDGSVVENHIELVRSLRGFLEMNAYACERNTCYGYDVMTMCG